LPPLDAALSNHAARALDFRPGRAWRCAMSIREQLLFALAGATLLAAAVALCDPRVISVMTSWPASGQHTVQSDVEREAIFE
jgi:hypothetical protein